ncbi:hypothetical protein J4G37_57415, partial [Microvirga sp. 3-52]|nr:hypothetical protein [Microvirga sp. 3-52]
MQSKRKRILTMLENGTITTDEALTLLENLNEEQTSTETSQSPSLEETTESETSSDTTEKETTSSETEKKSDP